jgi:hypothetical protein
MPLRQIIVEDDNVESIETILTHGEVINLARSILHKGYKPQEIQYLHLQLSMFQSKMLTEKKIVPEEVSLALKRIEQEQGVPKGLLYETALLYNMTLPEPITFFEEPSQRAQEIRFYRDHVDIEKVLFQ